MQVMIISGVNFVMHIVQNAGLLLLVEFAARVNVVFGAVAAVALAPSPRYLYFWPTNSIEATRDLDHKEKG